ncbi:MAG: hypothetical protein ACRYFU_19205 [Janthinobacterium lividum]
MLTGLGYRGGGRWARRALCFLRLTEESGLGFAERLRCRAPLAGGTAAFLDVEAVAAVGVTAVAAAQGIDGLAGAGGGRGPGGAFDDLAVGVEEAGFGGERTWTRAGGGGSAGWTGGAGQLHFVNSGTGGRSGFPLGKGKGNDRTGG